MSPNRTLRFMRDETDTYTVSTLAGEVLGTVRKDGRTWFLRAGGGQQIAGGRTRQEAAEFLAQIVEGRAAREKPRLGPAPAASIADRRRRLEADAEDAKKALWNAQQLFDRICNELAELRREEMGN